MITTCGGAAGACAPGSRELGRNSFFESDFGLKIDEKDCSCLGIDVFAPFSDFFLSVSALLSWALKNGVS
jgi:hypothetical protein